MALSEPPIFQRHRVEAEKSYLQPALRVKGGSEELVNGRADWRNSVRSPSRLTAVGIPPPPLAPSQLFSRPPTARRVRPRGDVTARQPVGTGAQPPGARTLRPRSGSRKPGATRRGASRTRGSLRAGAPAGRRRETAGMRQAAERRRRSAGLARRRRSGSPGWSGRCVLGGSGLRGEGGEEGDGEGP